MILHRRLAGGSLAGVEIVVIATRWSEYAALADLLGPGQTVFDARRKGDVPPPFLPRLKLTDNQYYVFWGCRRPGVQAGPMPTVSIAA
jgi:hypothetical protein